MTHPKIYLAGGGATDDQCTRLVTVAESMKPVIGGEVGVLEKKGRQHARAFTLTLWDSRRLPTKHAQNLNPGMLNNGPSIHWVGG